MRFEEREEELLTIQKSISRLIIGFEERTGVRVDSLSIDNRMRNTGGCSDHHIVVCADIEQLG